MTGSRPGVPTRDAVTSNVPPRVPVTHVPVHRVPIAGVLVPIVLLAVVGCSRDGKPDSAPPWPTTTAASASTPTDVVVPLTPAPTSTATSTPTTAPTSARTTGAPRPGTTTSGPAPDTQQQRIAVLQTEGGVPSLVVRLTTSGTVPTVHTSSVRVGQTLRLIIVSPVATHLIGKGLGVDADVPAANPVAVDVVAFTPGSYSITTRAGAVIARLVVAS